MELEELQNELIKAQEKQNINDTNILLTKIGFYYQQQNDVDNMKKYYLMATDNNFRHAMYLLARYYDNQNDIKMVKYYLMAIENNHSNAMNYLGTFCKKINNISDMKKYYLMAI